MPRTTANEDADCGPSHWQSLQQGHPQRGQGHASAQQRASSASLSGTGPQQRPLPATALAQAPLSFVQSGCSTAPWQQHSSARNLQQGPPQAFHSTPIQSPNVIMRSACPAHESAAVQSNSESHPSSSHYWHPGADASMPQASWQTQTLHSGMPSSYRMRAWQRSNAAGISPIHTPSPAADAKPCPWAMPLQHPQGPPVSDPAARLTATPAAATWAIPQQEAPAGHLLRAAAASRPASRCDHPLYAHLDLSRPLCLQQPAAFPNNGSMHFSPCSASSFGTEAQGDLQPQQPVPRDAAPSAPQIPQQQLQGDAAVIDANHRLHQQWQQQRGPGVHAPHWQQQPQLPAVSQQWSTSPEQCHPQAQEQRRANAYASHSAQDALPQQHSHSRTGAVQSAAFRPHLDQPSEGVVACDSAVAAEPAKCHLTL